MKTSKLVWSVGVVFVVLGLLFVFFRIGKINRQYPQTVEKDVEKGSYCEVDSEVEMCVIDARWLNGEKLQKEYGDVWYVDTPSDYQAVEVTIKVRNCSKTKQKIELFKTYIESEQYDWNGCDADLFMAKNNMPLEVELESGQEIECVLPYTFLKENYTASDWMHLNRITYFLVRERYPQKMRWLI